MSGPSDIVKAIAVAQATIATTRHVIDADTGKSAPKPVPPELAGVLQQHFNALRHVTTSLALAYKPPITPAAVLQQLGKFVAEICRAISVLIVAADGASFQASLTLQEWSSAVLDVVSAAQHFLGSLDGKNLVPTALVWDAIDKSALSSTESEALGKRWRADTAVVKDAWREFKEALESMKDEPSGDGGGTAGALDEWDELEAALDDETISPEEAVRVEQAKPLLALYQILQTAMPRHFDDSTFPLIDMLATSTTFVAAFDDAIFSLHPPQSTDGIQEALSALEAAATGITSAAIRSGMGVDFCNRWQTKHAEERQKCGAVDA